jgi:tetratricopeptide (TPR) repeat protein
MPSRTTLAVSAAGLVVAAVAGLVFFDAAPRAVAVAPTDRTVSTTVTSREGLASAIASLTARVAANRADEHAAVSLADALIRQARVTGDATLPKRAEEIVDGAIGATDSYLARRMRGVVLLSQHRFAEALEAARRARALRPDDPWNDGVIGDAALELGRYEEAFAAFDRMAARRPSASVYARVAYARELQGDLRGAREAMRAAVEATSPHDPEGLAWTWSQLGALELQDGRPDEASRAYQRALAAFPGHPYARRGLARIAVARGDLAGALAAHRALHAEAPTPELAAQVGDLLLALDDQGAASASWAEAERLERDGWANEAPQPAALARMLAERNLKPAEALRLAREAARTRDDIVTNDTLAWALYRTGSFDEAWQASARARRTGTRDARILVHAAAIARARGDHAAARDLARRALEGGGRFDLVVAREAGGLLTDQRPRRSRRKARKVTR